MQLRLERRGVAGHRRKGRVATSTSPRLDSRRQLRKSDRDTVTYLRIDTTSMWHGDLPEGPTVFLDWCLGVFLDWCVGDGQM